LAIPRTSPALPGDPYRNPDLFRFVGSMEGVPEWVNPAETAEERAARSGWRARGHALLEMAGQLMPGLALAAALAVLGTALSGWIGLHALGLRASPISPILLAILAGLLIRNTVGLPAVYELGLQLALKRLLRIGVALLGIRLSLAAIGAIGLAALPVVAACIVAALVLVAWAGRALGVSRRLGTLVAVGTAICGNTAIVATGPAIRATQEEVSYAVGTITVFGLVALVVYPFASHLLFGGDAAAIGLFLGTAIHDTAQVAGAGLLYGQQYGAPEVLETATVTKLVRNLFMIVVIPLMALHYHRGAVDRAAPTRPALGQTLPLFVLGFVAMALLRTLGDLGERPLFGWLGAEDWQALIEAVSTLSTWCLTVAMASVGLGTHFGRLRRLGLRPLALGLAAALTVGAVSTGLLYGLSPWLAKLVP
jgi:uncharacterized integral membrane protein (TIGR00698 family)